MPTNQTTPEQPQVDSAAVLRLIGAVGLFHEAHWTHSVQAFNNLCEQLSDQGSAIDDLYTPMNEAENKGKSKRTDISFGRFYSGLSGYCTALKREIPDRRETRMLFVFVRQGNSQSARDHFLRAASVSGDFQVTFPEYVRFLGVRDQYTKGGKLTESAAQARAAAEAERVRQDAIRKAATTSRPMAYDWTTAAPADIRDNPQKLATWGRLMAQDLNVWVDSIVRTLSDAQARSVNKAVDQQIKAHAVK